MCKRLLLFTSFLVLVLSLAGSAPAAVPAGWSNQDIGNSAGGSADEADGTWTITGEGADIWGTADAFQYAYLELNGNAQMVARVVDNGTGSNEWAKGGVMIRQSVAAGSTHAYMPITGGGGNGASFQGRPAANGSSVNSDSGATVAPPYWVKLERIGNDFSGFISPDGVAWTQLGAARETVMTDPVLIGLAVTSHAAGQLRTFTFDNVSIELLENTAVKPVPADGAVDADVTALEWTAGSGAVSHRVYLSTDAAIDESDLVGETQLTIQVVTVEPGTTYYWRVDEIDADGNVTEGKVWSFTTIPLEAHFPNPADGATWQSLSSKLSWTPGKVAIMHDVYFGTDQAAIAARDMTTFKGKLITASYDPGPLAPDTTYYWAVDQFTPTGTVAGPVWSFTTLDPEIATGLTPSDGAAGVSSTPTLSWQAGASAVQHDIYLGRDEALVAAGDASVLLSQQAETSVVLTNALDRGTTWYWKVDVTTADGKVHMGFVSSFTIADQNTDNWAVGVGAAGPTYLDTFVKDGLYDIGAYGGEQTYEFIVRSNPDETQASMCLIGRRDFGDTKVGLKYEQWNNTGTYGATVFGVADYDYGVPTSPGEYTHLAFVSSEAAGTTELYVNGVLEGSVSTAISLSGLVGIGYGAQDRPPADPFFDDFDGDIFGVAIYDRILSAEEIAANSDRYFNPIPITDPDLLIHYDFESGEGGVAIDRSGHSNHGMFMGSPQWVPGLFGTAVSIDIATLDYVQTAAPLGIVTNTVSVTGWVYHDVSPAAWSGILTHRGTSPGNIGLQHNGTELRYMWGADEYWSFSSGLAIPNGEWYFAALTISPDQGKLYLNGVDQTATNVAPHQLTTFDSLIRVGRDHNDGRIMTSLIDEVRFYNRTLTDTDIQKMMVSDITAPGDVVRGVPDDGDWPGAETPDLAIDDNTATKYLHFKGDFAPDPGTGGTGLQITPAAGPTIVTGLALTTANDVPGRDPIAFELSGSNDGIDGPYEVIASGDIVDFAQEVEWPRFTTNATAISFSNDKAYAHYQLIFTAIRGPVGGSVNSMQIAEVELLGTVAYENILANGGLEDDLTGAGWNTYGDASMEVVHDLVDAVVPDGPVEGEHCLHVTVGSAGANFWDAGLQHGGHVFEAGKSYTLSVWFKSKSGPFQINIKPERAASPWEGYGDQQITITEEWAEYTVNTGVIGETVDPASITFHIAYAPGEFWVDNALFYEDR